MPTSLVCHPLVGTWVEPLKAIAPVLMPPHCNACATGREGVRVGSQYDLGPLECPGTALSRLGHPIGRRVSDSSFVAQNAGWLETATCWCVG